MLENEIHNIITVRRNNMYQNHTNITMVVYKIILISIHNFPCRLVFILFLFFFIYKRRLTVSGGCR